MTSFIDDHKEHVQTLFLRGLISRKVYRSLMDRIAGALLTHRTDSPPATQTRPLPTVAAPAGELSVREQMDPDDQLFM